MEGIPFFTQFAQSCNASKSALCSWLFIIVIAVAKYKWGNRFNGINLKECFTILPDWWGMQWQRINGSIVGWFNLCRSGFKRLFECLMIFAIGDDCSSTRWIGKYISDFDFINVFLVFISKRVLRSWLLGIITLAEDKWSNRWRISHILS